jgi:uncharacterized protein (TIGR02147 family)
MGNPAWQDTLWSTEDYRVFLRSWYEQKKASRPNFSLRVLGNKLFMDPSLLSKIFQGERHLATSRIQPVCDLVGLSGNHAEYFRHLVLHAKSKTAREAQALFERMQELRRVAPVQLDDAQESYWDSWVHLALRSLLTCGDFKDDWKTLGDLLRPRQSANAAKKAMKALERLDLVAKDDDGFWRPNDPFVRDRPGSITDTLEPMSRLTGIMEVQDTGCRWWGWERPPSAILRGGSCWTACLPERCPWQSPELGKPSGRPFQWTQAPAPWHCSPSTPSLPFWRTCSPVPWFPLPRRASRRHSPTPPLATQAPSPWLSRSGEPIPSAPRGSFPGAHRTHRKFFWRGSVRTRWISR